MIKTRNIFSNENRAKKFPQSYIIFVIRPRQYAELHIFFVGKTRRRPVAPKKYFNSKALKINMKKIFLKIDNEKFGAY